MTPDEAKLTKTIVNTLLKHLHATTQALRDASSYDGDKQDRRTAEAYGFGAIIRKSNQLLTRYGHRPTGQGGQR